MLIRVRTPEPDCGEVDPEVERVTRAITRRLRYVMVPIGVALLVGNVVLRPISLVAMLAWDVLVVIAARYVARWSGVYAREFRWQDLHPWRTRAYRRAGAESVFGPYQAAQWGATPAQVQTLTQWQIPLHVLAGRTGEEG